VGHVKKGDDGQRIIGKHMPGDRYLHKDYLPEGIREQVERSKSLLPEGHTYNIVKLGKDGSISFINSPDFDTSDEPIVGDAYKVSRDGKVTRTKQKADPQIYHHKWQMVGNDYKGFDVQKAKERSQFWTEHPAFLRKMSEEYRLSSKIGTKSKWDEVLKYIDDPINATDAGIPEKDENYHPEKTSINKDKLPAGITTALRTNLIPQNALVLDYGGGSFDNGKDEIEAKVPGSQVYVYDPYSREKSHNDGVMDVFKNQKADIVMNHNVLNVIADPDERSEVLQNAFSHLKEGGKLLISVYIGEGNNKPRKVPQPGGGWNWQENRKTKEYIPEIQAALPDTTISTKGQLIIVTKNNP
jgi:SAM-dependent methyltransferase